MKAKLDNNGKETRVTLQGEITETAVECLQDLESQLSGPVVFDCDGIKQINSYGVTSWVAFLSQLSGPYRFIRCRTNFIDYTNLVPAFIGAGPIDSFYFDYECDDCDHTLSELIETAQVVSGDSSIDETTPCPRCNSSMQAAEDPEDYLVFTLRSRD